MRTYAITGASSGIGAKLKEILSAEGHRVINIDLKGGDVDANLATPEGRQAAIDQLHQLCPDGLDGLVCNAGVSGSCGNLSLILSLNYFGAIAVAEGAYDLLQKRGGACIVTASNSLAQSAVRRDLADLLNNHGVEADLLAYAETLDVAQQAHPFYATSKFALARWMRRNSAKWASGGVRLNSVAPGNVKTPMTDQLTPAQVEAVKALPVPTNYASGEPFMDPVDIANAMVFLLSPQAHGVNGVVLFVDGGTDALTTPDKVG